MSRLLRTAIVTAGVLLVSPAMTGVASAHVSVHGDDPAPGGFGVVSLLVPNESDTAGTVGVRVQLPPDTPFASVLTPAMPGWTVSLTRVAVDPPITDDDGQDISEAVGIVTWTAEAGTRIGPDEYAEFSLNVGPFPDVDSLVFKVIQTYDDGSEVAWIEEPVDGQAEPEHPTPVLTLGDATTDGHSGTTDTADNGSPGDGRHDDDSGGGLTVTALILGSAGLLAGLAGLALGLNLRRRTVEK